MNVDENMDALMKAADIRPIRAQGPGGQNVNKVSSAVHLRFDVHASSLPDEVKQRLLRMKDKRISKEGVVVIKAQKRRSLEKNTEDALMRLQEMVRRAAQAPKRRVPTKPKPVSREKRMDEKVRRGRLKNMRKPVAPDDDA